MKKTLWLTLFFIVSSPLWAQDCDIAKGLQSIAALEAKGDSASAFEKSEALLACTPLSKEEEIELHIWQFKLHRNHYREKNANRAILRAKSLWEETGKPFSFNFRLLLIESSALRKDTTVYNPMLRAFRDELFAKNESDYHEYLGRYYFLINYEGNNAIPNFLKALGHFEQMENPPVFHMGVTLRGLGNMNRNQGDFEKSLAYYSKERDLYAQHYPEDHFNISICNFNMGNVFYETLEYQSALDHYLKVPPVWEKRYASDHYRMKTLNEAIGDMYWELGDQSNALSYFEKATENEALVNNDASELTISNADSLLQKGNYADAISYYKEAVAWREKTYGEAHTMTGACKNFVARAIRSSGDTEGALSMYQEAIQIFVPELQDTDWTSNPSADMKINSLIYLLEALTAKGELLQERYAQNQDVSYLEGALQTQKVAIGILERIKNTHISESSKLFWTSKTRSLIEGSMETALQLAEVKQDNSYLDEAFNFSERSKALVLLSSLFEQETMSFSKVPAEITEQEKYFKDRINEYRGKINNEEKRCGEVRASLLTLFKNELQSTQGEYDLLLDQLKNDYPEYYELKYDPEIVTVEQIQESLLDDETQLISYFYGNNSIQVFSIQKSGISVRSIENPDLVLNQVNMLFANISSQKEIAENPQKSYEAFGSLSHDLYNILIAPELQGKNSKRLIIIPDGNLAYLPFEMLLSQPASEKRDYQNLSYLLKDHAVSYSQSASVRFLAQNLEGTHSQYIGFAPSYEGPADNEIRQELSQLKHNTTEVTFAKKLFGGNSWVGNGVSEELLKEHSGKAGILHLAMHGEVEDEHPLLSKLYFNPSEKEDGLLHTYEIYSLDIPSQLVILSACNTATGKLESGEGILSLERAFQYAGSKSLLSTLWTVDDASSAEITQYFLENLDMGKHKDVALQEAKLKFINNTSPEKLAPFYWSSFKLTGNTMVFSEEWNPIPIWIGAGVLFIIFAIVFYRRKQR
ncbi:CHAT domain-containing protein [Aureisphaera galaxeae]|uniref:CHAT domain-containing protein n=1 Tax=Aureisphaera galaxeae TaxID=1538023 RepID=UPI00234FC4FC|nr:CHAT domain-containing tetratricopeptide repeat protein [Aureisphaera galaxeae]MDC8003374.1 CHAT domain-containing protein [Aureisphaera galaxeae]